MHKFSTAATKSSALTAFRSVGLLNVPWFFFTRLSALFRTRNRESHSSSVRDSACWPWVFLPVVPENRAKYSLYDPGVLYRARQEGKPVLLEFFADWCIPCLELEEHTFSNEGVINSTWSFVRVRVDMSDYESSESERLREKFGVTGVPEMLFLDARGNELTDERIIGFVGPEDFLRRMERALKPGSRQSLPTGSD